MVSKDKVPTDQVILACTIEIIDEHGEAGVRIADITERTGVSISSIYHFFHDREGLIAAAQVERYIANLNELFDVVLEWVGPATTREEFRDSLIGMFHYLLIPERAGVRLARLNVIGGVVGRPELAARLAEIQDDLTTKMAALLDGPIALGWIRPDTDPKATVTWLVGTYMQRALIEMGPTSIDPDAWNRIALRSILAVVFDELQPVVEPQVLSRGL